MSADLNVTALLEPHAQKWMCATAIAAPGDIVETQWGDWKSPRKVRIASVGCHVICQYKHGEFCMELEMRYSAHRLRKDGSSSERPGTSGICLTNLRQPDGREWRQGEDKNRSAFNHFGLTFQYRGAK